MSTLNYNLNFTSSADKVTAKILRLDKSINRTNKDVNKFRGNLKKAFDRIPGSEILSNPIAQVGFAFFSATKMSFKFSEGMAKVNTTAQLSDDKIKSLGDSLLKMGKNAGANLSEIPDAYEKILSQTGDVTLSQDILEQALKGSKAGFTDVNVVAGALAQSLSLIGKENTNASEVLDTFFAAKRVGAGEFGDFARYMPNLISSGKSLGVTYKQTAGLFAFMTGKGFAAERSATLLENAYSALGKTNIQDNLSKNGVSIFDKDGAVKDMGEIFKSLQDKLSTMTDKKKSNFLAKIGLVDKEARSAFIVLTSDNKKLKEALSATAKSSGETNNAFDKAKNPMLAISKLWSSIQFITIKLGGVIAMVLVPALSAVLFVITPLTDALGWFVTEIENGNPYLIGFATTIGVLTLAYKANAIWQQAQVLWTKRIIVQQKLKAIWDKVTAVSTALVTGATILWTGAQWLLNAALTANPIGLIVAGVALLIAGIVWLVSKTEGWGEMWKHTIKTAKLVVKLFVDTVKLQFITMFNGIMIVIDKIKLGWYKFKEAVGIGDSTENQKMIAKINADTDKRIQAIKDAAKRVKDTAINAAVEFGTAAASIHVKVEKQVVNNKYKSDGKVQSAMSQEEIDKQNNYIPFPSMVGANRTKTKNNNDKTKTNKAIATGGTKHNYITITLEQLIGVLNIKGNDFKDSAKQMQDAGTDALLRTLALATTAGN